MAITHFASTCTKSNRSKHEPNSCCRNQTKYYIPPFKRTVLLKSQSAIIHLSALLCYIFLSIWSYRFPWKYQGVRLNGGIRYMHQKSCTSKQNWVYFGSLVHVWFAFCHIIKSNLKLILLQYFFKLPVLFSFHTCYDNSTQKVSITYILMTITQPDCFTGEYH